MFPMIRNEIERQIRIGYSFKIEVKSQYGSSLYTIIKTEALDDEGFAFIDVKQNRTAIRLELIVRVFR